MCLDKSVTLVVNIAPWSPIAKQILVYLTWSTCFMPVVRHAEKAVLKEMKSLIYLVQFLFRL
jgi:hypothetical protein